MNAPQSLPPQAVLAQMINGYWVTGTIVAAARLRLPDLLSDGPRTTADLAKTTETNEDALYRLMRALASVGIFSETEPRTFEQTSLSDALRANVPGSMRGLAAMTGLLHLRAWPEIVHSVKTGETAFAKVFGKDIFEYLPTDKDAAAAFDEAMTSYTATVSKAIAAGYDFSSTKLVVDVGGGSGALATEILKANPGARGITFDLPHVADRARAFVSAQGLADRCAIEGGDFFESVPSGGDAYLLKMILHDWDDAKCVAILKSVRKAIRPDGKLLVMEAVLPPGNTPSAGKLLDINMLVMTGGRERTEPEFRALYRDAGFELTRIVPAHPTANVIEGRPI